MAEYLVTCVVKQRHANPHEGITHLGGLNWRHTRQEVINSMDRGNTYVLRLNGHGTGIAIFKSVNGEYPRGYADLTWNDNLLLVPHC